MLTHRIGVPSDANNAQKPTKYLVTLITPNGVGQIEVPTFLGPDAAGRRAHMCAVAAGWGDLDEVKVASVTEIEEG